SVMRNPTKTVCWVTVYGLRITDSASFGIALPAARTPLDDAGGQVADEFGVEARPCAAVKERDAVVGGFEERQVQIAPHLLPLAAAVDERLDGSGGQALVLEDAVEEALSVVDAETDEQVVVAPVRPIAARHRSVQHDELDLLAALREGRLDVVAQPLN